MIREEIRNLIENAIEKLQKEAGFKITVEKPENEAFGDYSTNAAMLIAKKFGKSPKEVAESILLKIQKEKSELLDRAEIAGPGFINFFASKERLQKQVGEILKQKDKFGTLKPKKAKSINVEFVSANPTGPLHLGHGRGAFWGDALSNVLEKAGNKVTREYFINDYGNQIQLLGKSVDAACKELLGKPSEVGEGFYKGEYVKDIAGEIIKKNKAKYLGLEEAERIKMLTEFGLKKMLGEAKSVLDKVGVKYDVWFSERELYKRGAIKKAISILKGKGLVYEKEGALWFKSTEFGDDKDRVLIKADGETTYFASDIAYHLDKVSRKYDLMIDGWGGDHFGYVPRMMAIARIFGFEKKFKIVIGQFVRLIEGGQEVKMSKRGGTFVTLEELVDQVGADVAKFFFLTKSINTHIDFNLDLAKEQSDKNPVFYIQYAYARICSIIRNSKPLDAAPDKKGLNLLNHQSELALIKQLIRLPEVVEDTANDFQIQRLPQYALDLATAFHQFYRDCRVLTENRSLSRARLGLVLTAKIVLKSTLNIMGVSAPEKM